MKTRRALQIIVGILSLLVLVALLVAAACVCIALLFDTATLSDIYSKVISGFQAVAQTISLADVWFVLPIIVCLLPAQLMLIATILLFLRNNEKQGKYIAGSILSLIAIALLTIFPIVFAKGLVSEFDNASTLPLSYEWIVRLICAGLLAVFIIFIGSALGVKPKMQTSQDADEEQDATASTTGTTFDTVSPTDAQQTGAPDNVGYVPAHEHSMSEILNGVYGTGKTNSASLDKINKARWLYDMGAITQDEFVKLVNKYTQE